MRLQIHKLTTIMLVLTTFVVLTNLALAQEWENPIKVTGEEFDFGYIPFGKTVKHTLNIINDADTALTITRVSPGCGCTTIPLRQRVAMPGDTLVVDMLLDTGDIRPGEFQKSPRIYTDSRLRPQIVCKLKGINFDAKGQEILVISPNAVELPRERTSDSFTISLENVTQLTLVPRLIEAPPPALIDVDVPRRAIVPGRQMVIDLKLRDLSSVRVDAIYESITLAFNDPDRTRVTIPIKILK